MALFEYRQGVLHAEAVSLEAIAEEYGTPVYVYSRGCIEARYGALEAALG
ncbi:MAG: diaminopimelate decarboxylase, partial [Gammaproteobacteria bacterium]